MNYLKMLYEQFKNLAGWQKAVIISVAFVAFTGVIAFAFFFSGGDYVVLYRNLDLETAANIKEKIEEGNYKYKIADNGATIMVSPAEKEVILLKLAKDNVLPDRSKGYEDIFGKSSNAFSNSRKIEDLNILRGLQAEIETTIKRSSKIISSARLHIFYAPERTFKEDQKQDKATVFVALKAGKKIEDDQIIGIRNLVANATGIDEDNVSIIDQNFVDVSKRLRSNKKDENYAADQYTLQKKYIEEKEIKLQEMLDRILGGGRSVVTVHAELNFDKREVFDESLAPPIKGEEGGVVISEELNEETFKGKGKKPVGVPGTQSNIPTYPDSKNEQDEYVSKAVKKNYDLSKKQEKIVYAVGDVKRLNVSVVVDDILTNEQRTKIENAIVSAAGIVKQRGDTVVVEKYPFNREDIKVQEKQAQQDKLQDMFFQLLLVIIPTGGIFFVLWFVWKNKELIITHFKPIEIKKEASTEEVLPLEARERVQKVDLIKDFINKSPKDAATLLQIWLTAE
ncbi:MAG TPA: flagellar basal-body MS-ring/collar protein FliF [Candidatus Wallbacteria bacterium]|nr:flagellar basal-body MS-ring/collar protein FliF [Candidatus Wallbacteria bacterium]